MTIDLRSRVTDRTHFERRSGDRNRVDVSVTSRRYRQTNSSQALKYTNRFTRLGLGLGLGLELGLEEVFVFDSKSEGVTSCDVTLHFLYHS